MTAVAEQVEFRALVVDDESIVRRMVSFALQQEGFSCDTATDGDQAIALLSSTSYDLLVTDLRMPNKHGHALATEVIARDSHPVIIVHTGVIEPRLAKDLLGRGVSDIVYKPTDYETFAAKAKSLVARESGRVDQNGSDAAEPQELGTPHTVLGADDAVGGRVDNIKQGCLEDVESHLISGMSSLPPELLSELIPLQPEPDQQTPQDALDLLNRLSRPSPYAAKDRREVDRLAVRACAMCLQYNEHFLQVGEPITVYLRDLSLDGVGFVSRQSLSEKYVGLSWSTEQRQGIRAFAEVLRVRAYESLYEVGCRFLEEV